MDIPPLFTHSHFMVVHKILPKYSTAREEDDADQAQDPPVPPVVVALSTEGEVDRLQDEDYHVEGHVRIGHFLGLLLS